jgi:hypothetical protein
MITDADHHIRTFVKRAYEGSQNGRIMLAIGIHRDNILATQLIGPRETRVERLIVAAINLVPDYRGARSCSQLTRFVAGAIVHNDRHPILTSVGHHRSNRCRLIKRWDDYAYSRSLHLR